MTKKEWLDDFSSFYDMMKENYPYFWVKERLLDYNWIDLKDKYLERLEKANEVQEFLEIFWDAVIAMQNAHTIIWMPDWMEYHFQKGSYFQENEPFRTIFSKKVKEAREYWKPILGKSFENRYGLNFEVLITYVKGEYVIVDGYNSWKEKYGEGSKIKAVNGKPIDELIGDTFEKGNIEWDFKRKKLYMFKVAPRHFGADAVFTIEKTNGETSEHVFKSSTKFSFELFKYPKERLTMKTWLNKQIAYLRFHSFEEEGYMDEEHDLLISFYKHIKDCKYLIIDVTGNQGGCYLPWMKNVIAPLIKKKLESKMYLGFRKGEYGNLFRNLYVTKIDKIVPKDSFDYLPPEVLTDDFTVYDYTQIVEPSNEVDFKGEVIVLADMITFSATDAFALFCKETGFAKLYGVPTAGDGISESPIYFVLPNSKIVIRFQPGMGIDYTGHASEEDRVHPDVYFEGNHQEILDFVLKEIEKKEEKNKEKG